MAVVDGLPSEAELIHIRKALGQVSSSNSSPPPPTPSASSVPPPSAGDAPTEYILHATEINFFTKVVLKGKVSRLKQEWFKRSPTFTLEKQMLRLPSPEAKEYLYQMWLRVADDLHRSIYRVPLASVFEGDAIPEDRNLVLRYIYRIMETVLLLHLLEVNKKFGKSVPEIELWIMKETQKRGLTVK